MKQGASTVNADEEKDDKDMVVGQWMITSSKDCRAVLKIQENDIEKESTLI